MNYIKNPKLRISEKQRNVDNLIKNILISKL